MTRLKLLITPLSLLLIVLGACSDHRGPARYSNATSSRSTPPTVVVVATRYLLIERGYITDEKGCLFMEQSGVKHYTLVWWPQLRPVVHEDRGTVDILAPDSEPMVITLNSQLVQFGGGLVSPQVQNLTS